MFFYNRVFFRSIVYLLIPLLVIVSCTVENLDSYYDLNDIKKEGSTYVFRSVKGDEERKFKRYVRISQNDTLFITKALNREGKPMEVFTEKLSYDESTLHEFYFIDYIDNDTDTLFSKVILNKVYSLNESDYPLVWEASVNHKKFGYWKYRKERSIQKKNIKYRFMDTVSNCLKFHDIVTVLDKNGRVIDSLERYSFYAKDYGLVGFLERSKNKTFTEYKLVQIN